MPPVPMDADTLITGGLLAPMPTGAKHRTTVAVVHAVLWHALDPSIIDDVASVDAKLRPRSVSEMDPVDAAFANAV